MSENHEDVRTMFVNVEDSMSQELMTERRAEATRDAESGRGLGKRRLVQVGYRNPNVTTILHTEAQHERWACKDECVPIYEYRTLYGDDRYDRYYNANDPEAFARCKAAAGCGGELYSCSGFCAGISGDDEEPELIDGDVTP